jgi:hypothetical protein
VEITHSLSLPMLTPELVLDLLARAELEANDARWDNQMRIWLEQTLKPAYES